MPPAQLLDYLTTEAHLTMLDLAELPAPHQGITQQYLRASATELTEALDAQPTEEAAGLYAHSIPFVMKLLSPFILSVFCLLVLAASPSAVRAQAGGRGRPAQPGGHLNQLDNARIAFLTARLTLTQDQAQRFWPVYNDFITKRRALNRSARQVRVATTNPNLTDTQLRDSFNQEFAIRQQQLTLEKNYFEQAQKVLSLHQLAQFYQAERDFTKEVLQRVASRPATAPTQE